MSVTSGFLSQFREKVLGVNAHVLVLKYSSDFREYRDVMAMMRDVPGVVGVAPFTINPMMVTHGDKTATGVLLKGVDPELMPTVLDLPMHVKVGKIEGLRRDGAKPPARPERAPSFSVSPMPSATGRLDEIPDGGIERDDAGRNLTLLHAIEEQIKEDEKRAEKMALADAGTVASDGGPHKGKTESKEANVETEEEAPAKDALVGSAVPDGGYASKLPDLDESNDLPEDIDPDPCTTPASVAKMPGLVVGTTLAKNIELKVGDCVQVTSPTIGYSFSAGAIRPPVAKQFRIIAIFEAGFDQYDSKLVYSDIYEAQAFYDQGDSVTGVEMKVSDIDHAWKTALLVHQKLGSNLYHTMDWEELNHGLFTALRIQKVGMSLVLAVIILVAAFTVIATLIMLVLQKKKEISVLKAMGATNTAILKVFLYQGGLIGALGTAAGLGLGLLVCKGLLVYGFPLDPKVYFISRLPVEVSYIDFITTSVIAMVICLLATIVPALYAAGIRPADGVRAD
jgi:lipoprotein-releasing system permease protein